VTPALRCALPLFLAEKPKEINHMLQDVSQYHNKLNEIEASHNPKQELANFLNGMSANEREFFLLNIAGYHTAKYMRDHYFLADGSDKLFNELAEDLAIEKNKSS
jgi:hypothetical protein